MIKGDRYNEEKLKWSLLPYEALKPVIEVLMYGAKKYSAWNWRKGLSWTETSESLLRHVYSFLNNEDYDDESKLSHVGHIATNAIFLCYMFLFRKDLDDRYKEKL